MYRRFLCHREPDRKMRQYKWNDQPEEIDTSEFFYLPDYEAPEEEYESEDGKKHRKVDFSPLQRIGPCDLREKCENEKDSEVRRVKKVSFFDPKKVLRSDSEKSREDVEYEDIGTEEKGNPETDIDSGSRKSPLSCRSLIEEHITYHHGREDDGELREVVVYIIKHDSETDKDREEKGLECLDISEGKNMWHTLNHRKVIHRVNDISGNFI